MTDDVTYRRAAVADATQISTGALQSQTEFAIHEYSAAGRERIKRFSSPESIRSYIERGDIYFVAENNDQIIGAIGIRDARQIVLMYVDKHWHRNGIASELWRLSRTECAKAGSDGYFTLHASSYAIPVYEKWGFRATGGVEDRDGIVTTPMELKYDGRGFA